MRLGDLRYEDASDSYGDPVSPRHGGPSSKYVYLRDCKKFLRLVAKGLPLGRPVEGRPSELSCRVKDNPGGPAVPGDASLEASREGVVLNVALVMREDHATACWRIGRRPYAVDGANNWVDDPDATPTDVADAIRSAWERATAPPEADASDGPPGILDYFAPEPFVPMTHDESLSQHPATVAWLESMHGGEGVAFGHALIEAYVRARVHPAPECADRVLQYLHGRRVIERDRLAVSASQRFFDTKGHSRSRSPEHVCPPSYFAWRPASG